MRMQKSLDMPKQLKPYTKVSHWNMGSDNSLWWGLSWALEDVYSISGLYPVAWSILPPVLGAHNKKCQQNLPNVPPWGRGGGKKHWLRAVCLWASSLTYLSPIQTLSKGDGVQWRFPEIIQSLGVTTCHGKVRCYDPNSAQSLMAALWAPNK